MSEETNNETFRANVLAEIKSIQEELNELKDLKKKTSRKPARKTKAKRKTAKRKPARKTKAKRKTAKRRR